MKNLIFSRNTAFLLLTTVFAVLLALSCTNRFFVAVLQPTHTKAITHDKIKVYIDISPKSLLKNRIAIINTSEETISVYPIDIVLRISRTGIMLPAVTDYRKYVRMRYAEANKKCSDADYPYSCTGSIDKLFKKALHVKPFEFGDIPPGKKRVGYIAFNLPDPLNKTDQSKKIAQTLRSEMNLLDGEIEVNVSSLATQREQRFVFPVNVVTSSDESNVLLGVLKNY